VKSLFQDVVRCRVGELASSGGVWTASFVFPPEFTGFDGHFPGNPMLPGIAQICAVQAVVAETDAGRDAVPLRLLSVKRCKFIRPVLPGETMDVAFVGETESGVLKCKADISVGGAACASLSLTFASGGAS
jgi:3-hydroxymyristoyl/3-hydroxydecanoyl-(acyl carrier protein) dehydratase